MALAVAHVDGNATTTGGTSASTGSWTATAGSLIIVVVTTFNTSGAAAAGDITDSKGNSYQLCGSSFGGANAIGIAMYYNNAGTRGATFNVTVNLVNSSADTSNIAVVEVTGQATSNVFDSTTFATATDSTTPFTITSAAAISGNQIAIYGVVLDTSGTNAFTQPTGYTVISHLDNGSQDLVFSSGYKINETGTPSPAAQNTDTVAAGREIFGTFKELGAVVDADQGLNRGLLRPPGLMSPRGLPVAIGDPSASSNATSASAGLASATSAANNAAANVAPAAAVATSVATAYNAGTNVSVFASAGVATATATANNAGKTVATTGGLATATATANNPSISLASALFVTSVSANGRYLLDQHGNPILPHVDWAWSLMVDLTTTEMGTYFANRQSHGINACVVSLVCGTTGGINDDGRTYDGITPFTNTALALRSTYWARVDTMISLAASYGITIFANPLNAQDWMDNMVTAGTTNVETYGSALASRYASSPNIVWFLGVDYQPETWDHDPYFEALADGLRDDATKLITIQLDYEKSNSFDDTTWAADGRIDFNSAYSYWPTYDCVLDGYNTNPPGSRTAMPTWLSEANFETENNSPGGAATTDETMRRQFWWTMTSGGCGVAYGHGAIWDFDTGWDDTSVLDTTAIDQLDGAKQFFEAIPWYDLVPEQSSGLVTAGRGTYHDDVQEDVLANDYVTVAKTADGLFGVIYIPDWATTGTLTLNTAVMSGAVTVTRVDPTNFAETVDTAPFSSPGNNAAGDGDWVLLVEGTPATNAAAGRAQATAAANNASASVAPNAGTASAATASAGTPAASIAPSGGLASATAAAQNAAPTNAVSGSAGAASATASGQSAAGSVAGGPGAASGTGTAGAPAGAIQVTAGRAQATASANNATISTASDTNVNAGLASATAAANDPSTSVAPGPTGAGATAAALNATASNSISGAAGSASGSASASSVAGSVAPGAGRAQATSSGLDASAGTAFSAAPGVATSTATAHSAGVSIKVTAGRGTAQATAYNASTPALFIPPVQTPFDQQFDICWSGPDTNLYLVFDDSTFFEVD